MDFAGRGRIELRSAMGNSRPGPEGAGGTPVVRDGTLLLQPGSVAAPVGNKAAATPAASRPAPAYDPDIEALDLNATAKKAAYALRRKHPDVEFTSGRRDKAEQASAMASNVILNRKWIEQTYAASKVSRACQKWVDDNADKKSKAEIAAGLEGVLEALTDAELSLLSRHLAGAAFDVRPVAEDAEKIKATIRGLAGLRKFLEKEGGLDRWHADF
jgi:hypothetical protein